MSRERTAVVIGGGIAGIQASLDLAEKDVKVYLVEKSPSIGGRMAQLDKTFPTNDCSICILSPKMIDCSTHPNIELLTYAEVVGVEGEAGDFRVRVVKYPRYVDADKCTGCGMCVEKCPTKVENEFEMKLGMTKAISMPFLQAVPRVVRIDAEHCLHFKTGKCGICEKTCERGAIDFEQKEEEVTLSAGAIVVATGFDVFDPGYMGEYGYGSHPNVVTAMELERLICASGPTGGHLNRPSDGKLPSSVVFFQCVGSRDSNQGKPYCSAVCCMHSTKEAILVREHYPDMPVKIFYTDMRAMGKGFQEYVDRAKEEYGVEYVRSKPGMVLPVGGNGDLDVVYEDTTTRQVEHYHAGMVVLATCLEPREDSPEMAKVLGIELNEDGFFRREDVMTGVVDSTRPGIFLAGYCMEPADIPESVAQASAAAARAFAAIGSDST